MEEKTSCSGREMNPKLLEAVEDGRFEDVKEMLENGEDVNTLHMTSKKTALHIAALACDVSAVELLLQFSPDLKKVDVEGNTPLHCAASKNSSSSADIVNLLVKAGADLEIENKSGRTALEECVARNNLPAVKVLVRGGARLGTALSLARTEETGQEIISYLEWAAREAASSVEDEKEILLRRLSELLEKEAEEIEAKRMEKKTLLDKTRANLQNQSKKMEEEIAEVERKSKELKAELTRYKNEEEMKIKALTQEVSELGLELDRKIIGRVSGEDVASCLECPVCLDLCKPPREIWQCPEGHIMCELCANRPEMRNCSQCRMTLTHENLSRNRALEELARKTLPSVEEEAGSRRGGRSRGGQGARRRQQVDRVFDIPDVYNLEEWYMDNEYPFLDEANYRVSPNQSHWFDLEVEEVEDDEEEDDRDAPSVVVSPSRSNTSSTYYNSRSRPQLQTHILSGRRSQPPPASRPWRGQRRRSPLYHNHQTQTSPLQPAPVTRHFYRGVGRHRPPGAEEGRTPAGMPSRFFR